MWENVCMFVYFMFGSCNWATEHILTKFTTTNVAYVGLKNEQYEFFWKNMKTNLYFGQKHQKISFNSLDKNCINDVYKPCATYRFWDLYNLTPTPFFLILALYMFLYKTSFFLSLSPSVQTTSNSLLYFHSTYFGSKYIKDKLYC